MAWNLLLLRSGCGCFRKEGGRKNKKRIKERMEAGAGSGKEGEGKRESKAQTTDKAISLHTF